MYAYTQLRYVENSIGHSQQMHMEIAHFSSTYTKRME